MPTRTHARAHSHTHKHVSTKKERRRKDVPRSLTTLFHTHKNPKFFVHVIDYNYNTVQILYSAVHRTERLDHISSWPRKEKDYFQITATGCIRSFAHITFAFTWIRNGSTPLATHHHHHHPPSPSFFTYHCDKCLNYFPEHNKHKILACNHTL